MTKTAKPKPALPQSGGSYVRQPKGGLKKAEGTKPAVPVEEQS